MNSVSISPGTASQPPLTVIGTEVSAVSTTRVTIQWRLNSQPGKDWLSAFHHPSCHRIPTRLGVTTSYGSPLVLDDRVVLWSVDAAEMGPAVAAGAAMIDRATRIAEIIAS